MANTLSAELILNISKFQAALRNAQNAVNKSFKGGGVGQSMAGGIASGLAKNAALITAGLAAVVATAAGIAAYKAGQIIAQGIAMAGENEKIQMRFEILTGSRGAGNRALAELREDAMRTGVTLEDMTDNVGKFIAFGFDPEKAMKLNKGILDVGGSVGMSTREMKLLGVALAQVAAKGVASMEELRQQIAEKGVPIFKALEQQLGVTGAELSKMIAEGKVGADVVLDMFSNVPDGEGPFARFAGGAEKMGKTLPGIVARMKTTWHEFLRVLGDPIIDSLKPAMEASLQALKAMIPGATTLGQSIADAVSSLTAMAMILSDVSWGKEIVAVMAGIGRSIGAYFVASGKTLINILSILVNPAFWAGMMQEWYRMATVFSNELIAGAIRVAKYLRDSAKSVWSTMTGRGGIKVEAPDMSGGMDWMKNAPTTEDLLAAAIGGLDAQLKAAADAFKDGYSDAGGSSPLGDLAALTAKLMAEQRAATAERNRLDGEANPMMGGGAAASSGGGGGFALNGALSQAINTISGRSAFSVIAQSAERSEATQRQIKEGQDKLKMILENVEKNTRPKLTPMGGQGYQDYSRFA